MGGAIVGCASEGNTRGRRAGREGVQANAGDRGPDGRGQEPARPGDGALITQLTEAHRQLNGQWFAGTLKGIPLRLSGKMATRLGHYDPGSRHLAPEIVMSRTHIAKHGWREAMHTLLHEMVHQWQHETGRPVDHGPEFRNKAREVGITPAARRATVSTLLRRTEWAQGLLAAVDSGRLDRTDIANDQWGQLRNNPDRAVAEKARELSGKKAIKGTAEMEAMIQKLLPVANRTGDAARGRQVFETSCQICHALNGKGQRIGPDLTGIGCPLYTSPNPRD